LLSKPLKPLIAATGYSRPQIQNPGAEGRT
jgi:hypothetical protein